MWPFILWGFDPINQVTPPQSSGHHFIITTIEYLTKWFKVIPLVSTDSTTSPKIPSFLETHIIYRFGIPSRIIIKNNTILKN